MVQYKTVHAVCVFIIISLSMGAYTPPESSPVQSQSRGVHNDRVESNQVCANSNGILVLFEQWTIKEI